MTQKTQIVLCNLSNYIEVSGLIFPVIQCACPKPYGITEILVHIKRRFAIANDVASTLSTQSY